MNGSIWIDRPFCTSGNHAGLVVYFDRWFLAATLNLWSNLLSEWAKACTWRITLCCSYSGFHGCRLSSGIVYTCVSRFNDWLNTRITKSLRLVKPSGETAISTLWKMFLFQILLLFSSFWWFHFHASFENFQGHLIWMFKV